MTTPGVRPVNPHFSSGPCAKRPGWSLEALSGAVLGRSHRAKPGKAKLQQAIDLTREVLQVPADYRIGIVPASDTGAVEMAMWSLLGERPVDMVAWESFGEGWVTDAVKQLKLKDARVLKAAYGEIVDFAEVDFDHDVVFTWNGTTSGVRLPERGRHPGTIATGLTICDATSAAFAQALDFAKLDVVTFSWQKVLGGEAAHGMLILSPRAVERLESYVPAWPLPKIFRLTAKGKLIEGIFSGETINTPSLLCIEDYLDALQLGRSRSAACTGLIARADANAKALNDWVDRTPWIANLAVDPAIRSNTSVCLKVVDPEVTSAPGRGAGRLRQGARRDAREGKGRLRHRRLSRRPARPAHLVRRHRRDGRHRGADAVARLGLRQGHQRTRRLRPSRPASFARVAGEGCRARPRDSASRRSLPIRPTSRGPPHPRPEQAPLLQDSPMAPRVLISDALSPAAVAIFKERGVEVDVKPGLDKDALAAIIGDYDGLAIRSATKVTAKLLEQASRLKVVGRAGIGVDNVDIPAATAKGVIVMNTPFGNSITTAEHAIALMFALAREIPAADASTQAGKWEKNRFMGVEITGKVLGIIGCGNIGSIVADRAVGLHMRVLAYDPVPVARAGHRSRRREGRTRRPAGPGRLHHAARADDAADQERPLGREPRQDQEGRAHHQLRARRPRRRGGAAQAARRRPCRRRRHRRLRGRARQGERAVRPSATSSARRISAPRPTRRRRTWRCRWPSRCRTTSIRGAISNAINFPSITAEEAPEAAGR